MSHKAVFLGEWVKVANMRNKRFAAGGACSICTRGTCAPVWYSLETHEVRCTKCFDAETAHWDADWQGPRYHLGFIRSEAEWPHLKPALKPSGGSVA
jgi:Zn ribbon nucleic-acid-binding protein